MARYEIKIRLNHVYSVELTATSDEEASAALNSLLQNDVPSLEGNYGGSFVNFVEGQNEVLSFFNKSSAEQRQEKLNSLSAYVNQLDSEEKTLLKEIVLGD